MKKVFFIFVSVIFILSIYLIVSQKLRWSFLDKAKENCLKNTKFTDAERLNCFLILIEQSTLRLGVKKTFDTVEQLYNQNRSFAANCHQFTHRIGQIAYGQYISKKNMEITPKLTSCGYGFFHGVMESLVPKSGDIKTARDFCSYFDSKLRSYSKNAGLACLHGIGHGITDFSDKKYRDKSTEEVIKSSLTTCEKVATTDEELFRCDSGVFNSLSIAMSAGNYGLAIDKVDPLWICKKIDRKHLRACYSDMTVALMIKEKNNFYQAAKYIEEITDDYFANQAMQGLSGLNAREYINRTENTYSDVIKDCRRLKKSLINTCLVGFISGLIEFGKPNSEYEKPIRFCAMSYLTADEKNICRDEIIKAMHFYLPKNNYTKICQLFDFKFQANCLL